MKKTNRWHDVISLYESKHPKKKKKNGNQNPPKEEEERGNGCFTTQEENGQKDQGEKGIIIGK